MNAKTRREIEKRMSQMPEPTPEQIRKIEERTKRHRKKYGTMNHRGFIGNLIDLFR